MKLWLQVLFAQGYLWRDRFPEEFPPDAHLRGERPSVFMFAFGLTFFALGVVSAYSGSRLFAGLCLLVGAGYMVSNIGVLRADRVLGSAAFWVSLSWASGAVALVGIVSLIVTSALYGWWIGFVMLLGYMTLPGTVAIFGIQSRYLFFFDPTRNAHRVEFNISGARDLWIDTYWRLPRQILFPQKERHA
jgi:hypothetical protein